MVFRLILIILALAGTGCDKTIGDFVSGARPSTDPPPIPPPDDEETQAAGGFKVSPGRVTSAAADMSMDATVTPTRRVVTGTDMSAVITINQSRPQ